MEIFGHMKNITETLLHFIIPNKSGFLGIID